MQNLPYYEDITKHFRFKYGFGKSSLFSKKEDALEYCKLTGYPPVFGVQTTKGKSYRKHIAIGYNQLWEEIQKPHVTCVCYHEVITGFINMYLDLEFQRESNPGICKDEDILQKVVIATRAAFRRTIKISPQDDEIRGSVASSGDKFSYHIVINISRAKKTMFDGSESCLAMANEIIKVALEDRKCWLYEREPGSPGDDSLPKGLDVFAKGPPTRAPTSTPGITKVEDAQDDVAMRDFLSGETAEAEANKKQKTVKSLIDLQPYGQMKTMRIMYSTKIEETEYRPLMPHTIGTTVPKNPNTVISREGWDKTKFLRSLIGFVDVADSVKYAVTVSYNADTGQALIEKKELPVKSNTVFCSTTTSTITTTTTTTTTSSSTTTTAVLDGNPFSGDDNIVVSGANLDYWYGRRTSNNPNMGGKGRYMTRAGDAEVPGIARDISEEYIQQTLGMLGPVLTKFDPENQCILFSTKSRACPFKGSNHGSAKMGQGPGNHLYVKLYLLTGVAVRLCHKCVDRSERLILPDKYRRGVINYMMVADKSTTCVDPRMGGMMSLLFDKNEQ